MSFSNYLETELLDHVFTTATSPSTKTLAQLQSSSGMRVLSRWGLGRVVLW
jgi:hypothetical protein